MKFIYSLAFLVFLTSCGKDSQTDLGGGQTTTVSGKIKRIIESDLITLKQADILTIEYDVNNRVSKLSSWHEDSTFNPVKITYADYSNFLYTSSSDFPSKCVIKHEAGNSQIDTTFYFYDTQSRVIKEEWFDGSTNSISLRNIYSYPSINLVNSLRYYKNNIGVFQQTNDDSLVFDAANRIKEIRYKVVQGQTRRKILLSYDNKSNPLSTLNIYKYIFTLDCQSNQYGAVSKSANNNLQNTSINSTGIITSNRTLNFDYSTNSFPVTGRDSIIFYLTPQQIDKFSLKYEYY